MRYYDEDKRFLYEGDTKVWQEKSMLRTAKLFIDREEGGLSCSGGVSTVFDVMTMRFLANLGLTKTHRRRKILFAAVKPILPLFQSKKAPDKSVGRVEVWGKHKGKDKVVYYTYVGHIAFITSAPCLQAAAWLHKGKFDKLPGGVYAPERLIGDPELFLSELRKRGVVMEYFE